MRFKLNNMEACYLLSPFSTRSPIDWIWLYYLYLLKGYYYYQGRYIVYKVGTVGTVEKTMVKPTFLPVPQYRTLSPLIRTKPVYFNFLAIFSGQTIYNVRN